MQRYINNRKPLDANAFSRLPLCSIRPKGWLRNQLQLMAWGATGHLGEIWPDVSDNSGWLGGTGENWERGPYYCDGLVPLAYLLDDDGLIRKAQRWIEWTINSQQPNGNFGPASNDDWWPRFVMLKVLISHYEATGDARVIELMTRYFAYKLANLDARPLEGWGRARGGDCLYSVFWLYNRTGDSSLLDLAAKLNAQTTDWTSIFSDFPFKEIVRTFGYDTHIVNIAMALKQPALASMLTHSKAQKEAPRKGIRELAKHHGQAHGMWGGDEWLAGKHPSRGIETCAVVEYMFSLEVLLEQFGDRMFGDILEKVAFNLLPASTTADMWCHQFDQQANQVLCTLDKRDWTCNDETSNLFGLMPNFGCCTANRHQGWPKYVASLWMATPEGGLACMSYAPCTVKAAFGDTVADVEVTGDYPFRDNVEIRLSVNRPTALPLLLRIPEWCDGSLSVTVNGSSVEPQVNDGYIRLDGPWTGSSLINVHMPMRVRVSRRYNDAACVERGPLVFPLGVGESWSKLRGSEPVPDWEVRPASPWNYAILLNDGDASYGLEVCESEAIPFQPFDSTQPPVVLKAKGRRLPKWQLEGNWAGAPPQSPVHSDEPLEDIKLVPYGCARLRVTELPVLDG